MKQLLTNVVARLTRHGRAPAVAKQGVAARLGVESLEERRLLSTTPLALHLASGPAAALTAGAQTVMDWKSSLVYSSFISRIKPGIFAPSMQGDTLQLFIAQGPGELSGQYLGALTINSEYAFGSFVGTWGNQQVSGTVAWSGTAGKQATVQFSTSAGVVYSLSVTVGPSGNWQMAGLSVSGTVFIPSFGQQSVSGYGYHN
jgi:hypothetical protein